MRISLTGATGRMGRAVQDIIDQADELALAGALTRDASEADIRAALRDSDALIDFTQPEALLHVAALAAEEGTALVSGTTGLDAGQQDALAALAGDIPILWAPNMSLGVTLLMALTEKAAATLDDSFDIEIVEMHHRHKVDAPSGTALGLGEAAAKGRGVALDRVACKSRDGQVGPRRSGEIGFATLRGGDVIGDHTVLFAGEGERIELTHKATRRDIFAAGAVRAARWIQGQPAGLYTMRDVLGL